jgi:L-lactate dehydrogenase complex protein LldG
MKSARNEILARVRSALTDRPTVLDTVRQYRGAGAVDGSDRLALLVDRLVDYKASVHQCASAQVAATVGGLLTQGRTVVPAGVPRSWLAGVQVVRDEPSLSTTQLDALAAALTTCVLAIAQTGTIVLDAGPGMGRRALTLIPDHHVVVVRVDQIVPAVPDAIDVLDPTRPLTWISGPSATSDIELKRVEGVHGPRRLDVVIVS